jgi:hypothetical protein
MSDVVTMSERKSVSRKPKKRSVEEWSIVIATAWQKSVIAIFEAGELLIAARNQLLASEFKTLCNEKLPFTYATAIKLMRIAGNPILSDKSHVQRLPASWGTLYELATLPAPQLQKALNSGIITPRTERKEIEALKPPREEHENPIESPPTAPITPEEQKQAAADAEEDRCIQWILDLNKKRQLELICNVILRCYEKLDEGAKIVWRGKIIDTLVVDANMPAAS